MSNPTSSPKVRRFIMALLCLAAIHLTAPWPGIQGLCNVFLVLGLAAGFDSLLTGLLWAAAGGWVLEGTLRMYPHLGGTPLANMVVCGIAYGLLLRWPPHSPKPYWGRQAALVIIHSLLVHLAVRVAAGAHPWGTGWLWSLLLVPFWASFALRLNAPIHRR